MVADLLSVGRPDARQFFAIVIAINFSPGLDPQKLHHALMATAVQHPELATLYRRDDSGELYAVRAPASALGVRVHDCTTASEKEMAARLQADADRYLDMSSDPPIAIDLYRLADGSSTILVQINHIVADGWSAELVVTSLLNHYIGATPREPEAVATFEDFVDWEEEETSGERGLANEIYWRPKIEAFRRPIRLGELAAQTGEKSGSALCRFECTGDEVAAIRSAARKANVSDYVFLMTGYVSAIAMMTGMERIVLRSNASNRTQPGFTRIIGCMADANALDVGLKLAASFRENAQRVASEINGAFEHQGSFLWAFRKLARQDPSLFGGGFNRFHFQKWTAQVEAGQVSASLLYDPEKPSLTFGGVTVKAIDLHRNRAFRDITAGYYESEDKIVVDAYFKSDVISATGLERMLKQMQHIIRKASADPDMPLADMRLPETPL
jgi:hypothetical protein